MGGADVGTGAAADAAALDRLDQTFAVALSKFERTGTYHFLADPFAQKAADASIGRRIDADAEILGQSNQPLGLGGLLQESAQGLFACRLHHHTLRLHRQATLAFDQTGLLGCRRLARQGDLHGAQAADPGGAFQGRVEADSGDADTGRRQIPQKIFPSVNCRSWPLTRIMIMMGRAFVSGRGSC